MWDLITGIASGVGDFFTGAVEGIGDIFGGGGYADINLGDPDIPMDLSGAADYVGGSIGDMFNVGELENFYEPVSGQFVDLTKSVFDYTSAPYSGLADIGGYMGMVGDIGGFMEGGPQGGPVSWMGQNISPSGAPGTEAAMQGTKSGSKTGVGQRAPSRSSGGSQGAGSQQGAAGGAGGFKVPTPQKLSDIAGATGGMMSVKAPGRAARATDYLPKLAARNTTAAQYIMHYSKVAGTKPASFKLT